jgi:hypothetical protein
MPITKLVGIRKARETRAAKEAELVRHSARRTHVPDAVLINSSIWRCAPDASHGSWGRHCEEIQDKCASRSDWRQGRLAGKATLCGGGGVLALVDATRVLSPLRRGRDGWTAPPSRTNGFVGVCFAWIDQSNTTRNRQTTAKGTAGARGGKGKRFPPEKNTSAKVGVVAYARPGTRRTDAGCAEGARHPRRRSSPCFGSLGR